MEMLDAKRELEELIRTGRPAPSESPSRLPLAAIFEKRAVFQHRAPQAHASEAHIKDLAKAPLAGIPLDHITVFWVGAYWVLLDGHHRLAAYRKAGWKHDVPVVVFRGDLDRAIGYAGKANSGDKLAMSRSEKQGLAWRLTCATGLSRSQTVLASKVSDGIVAEMRRVKEKLIRERGMSLADVAQLTWWQAKQKASGTEQEAGEVDYEAQLEEEAQELANRLVRVFGKHHHLRHEVLALALEKYDRRLPEALRECWGPDDYKDWSFGPETDEKPDF